MGGCHRPSGLLQRRGSKADRSGCRGREDRIRGERRDDVFLCKVGDKIISWKGGAGEGGLRKEENMQ